MTADIVNQIIKHVTPMLKYECNKCEELDSIYFSYIAKNLFFYIFYNKENTETEKRIREQIDDYICDYIKYDLNYEKYISKDLVRKARNYIGYSVPMTFFYFDEAIPKNLNKEISEATNKIFPSIWIKYYTVKIKGYLPKGILPQMAKLIAET